MNIRRDALTSKPRDKGGVLAPSDHVISDLRSPLMEKYVSRRQSEVVYHVSGGGGDDSAATSPLGGMSDSSSIMSRLSDMNEDGFYFRECTERDTRTLHR